VDQNPEEVRSRVPTRRRFLQASALVPALDLFAADYDLIVQGGRVLDASQKMDRMADIGIRDGKIAAIEPSIASSSAKETIDARGKIVTPGLIDIHTHLADKEMPPAICLADGVTSLVDAGSLGAENVGPLIKIAQSAPNRVRILLNIANRGIGGAGELLDIRSADAAAARRVIEGNRQWIVGIKARLSRSVAGENDLEALRRARQVADPLKAPIMVHVGDTASPLPAILNLLRPGDIVTHVYSPPPHGIMDDNGRVLPQVLEARRRGVLFDIGNGRIGHLTWEVAERAIQQDFLPDTISTDLSAASRTYQVFNLPNVLSKFLLLGMPLDQVIARVTANAARAIPEFKAYGTLRTGAVADVTVLDLKEGDFDFVDNLDVIRRGHRKLVTHAVVVAGKRMQV
jgi:dihydroorotase